MFTLEKGEIQSSKVEEDVNGDGVMVTQSNNVDDYKKIKNWKINGNNLFVGNIDSGKKFCLKYYSGKCDYTNLLSLCKINNNYKNKINNKYIYYYLLNNINNLTEKYLRGSNNKSLDIDNFNRMTLLIPSLEEQNEIVDYCDRNNNLIKLIENIMEDNKVTASNLLKF
jgi:restriction endonuclease S subunit